MMSRAFGIILCSAWTSSAFVLPATFRVDGLIRRMTCVSAKIPWDHDTTGGAHVHAGSLSMTIGEGNHAERSRRRVMADWGKAVATALVTTALTSGVPFPPQAAAIGPVKIALSEPEYSSVTCPPKTQVPGEKAGAGLKPICVQVSVTALNPTPKDIIDAAVFGFVFDEENTSVVANNPDGATDAGQFAIIDKVPIGQSRVKFQFVAAIEPTEDFNEKKLKFTSLKAISYPGGQRYGAITECEMNPLADGCDFD